MHDCTSIVVSGRVSTLRRTDRIVVLSEGRIEAVGNHSELLRRSPWYCRLNELQNSGPAPVSTADSAADSELVVIPFPKNSAIRRAA
ncbi:MAG UNVERIFIED_CONTAM: hypothetical protein LVR18_25535 [Planctomycetaceae bacterium]|jgi:ABC-type sulfate/molybdate transport systems ATPase subunit